MEQSCLDLIAEFLLLIISLDLVAEFPLVVVTWTLQRNFRRQGLGLVQTCRIFVVNRYLNFQKRFLVNCCKDVFGIKSLCEEVIVVFILKDVITLVCNGFLTTQLLPSWATCCSKLVPMGSDCAPLFLPAQICHP